MSFELSQKRVLEAGDVVPGGVNSTFRSGVRPHPLVFESASDARLVDLDGNELIDYVLGMGPMFLGHSPQSVISAARAQLGNSILVAGQTEAEYTAAELVVDMVPSAEAVRFSTSGTEAVQTALRVTRAATGRTKILKFEGHYHGWLDNVLWSTAPDPAVAGPADAPVPVPGSEGQLPTSDIVVLPWNRLDLVTERLAAGDVAAVIMEPVMFNHAGILPRPDYLAGVRRACDDTGTLLIFDEVITGFRVSPGGAQDILGVMPDLTVLGKAIANGFPVAALAGRTGLMELIGSQRVLHGGTYNTQSVSMAATVATLREIRSGRPHEHVDGVGGGLMAGLRHAFDEAGRAATIVGFPAVFNVRFGAPDAVDYRDFLAADRAAYADFALRMLHRGVRILPRGTWFVSSAHTEADSEATLEFVRAALRDG